MKTFKEFINEKNIGWNEFDFKPKELQISLMKGYDRTIINTVAMKEKILDILEKHYHGRNFIESRCADELLGLFGVVLSLPDDEAIEQWWAEGKESDKFWQEAPYRTNGDVVEEIKTALKYFITVWQ